MLHLIKLFLKAGYIDSNLLVQSDEGTPQGSILSPLLTNIFLHYVLDVWFEKLVKTKLKGYCELIRYADDFVCLVPKDAVRLEKGLRVRFERCKLELHPDKSHRITYGRYEMENAKKQGRRANTFDFLGFTHFCDKTRAGKFKIGRKTIRKKFITKCKEMTQWLKSERNSSQIKCWWKTLSAKLRGHYQYYGVSENSRCLQNFYYQTIKSLFKWLNRRSQKKSMTWENFNKYLKKYPLPKPKITHSFYTKSI